MSSKTRRNPRPVKTVRRPRGHLSRRGLVALCILFAVSLAALGALGMVTLAAGVPRADATAVWTGTEPATKAGGHKVAVFEDLAIGPGEVFSSVVVVGGDLLIEGVVSGSVVVVVGDLVVRSGARVGYGRWDSDDDAAVVSVFGNVTVEPGAEMSGRIVDVAGGASDAVTRTFVDPVARPWKWASIIDWIVSTILLVVLAVIVAALAPRKTAAVRDRARHHLLSSLGWGLLAAVIGIPVITVLLIVTVVGILAVIPWLAVVVPVLLLFGFIAVSALLGRLILGERGDRREQVMAAAVLGVVIFSVIRWIPFAGAVILALVVLVGLGATITAIWEGNRRPRKHTPTTQAPVTMPPPADQQPPGDGPWSPPGPPGA